MRRHPRLSLLCATAALTCAGVAGADDLDRLIAETFKKTSPAVVTLQATYTSKATGTEQKAVRNHIGVLVSPDGLVVFPGSMAGLVEKVSDIMVEVGGTQIPAKYVGARKALAFARLQPEEPREFPFVTFDPAARVEAGQQVLAIASLSATYNNARTVTASRIAAVLDTPSDLYVFGDKTVPQGALVVTTDGVPVGIVGFDEEFYKAAVRHPQQQQALAALLSQPTVLPGSLIAPLVKSPPREGAPNYAQEGWIGAVIDVIAQDVVAALGVPDKRGVYVSYVIPSSDVARAGLLQGDVIVACNGHTAAGQTPAELFEFRRTVQAIKPGTEVALDVYRDGKKVELKTKVEKTPPSYEHIAATPIPGLGLAAKPLTYDVRISYQLGWDEDGAIVAAIDAGGPAALAGVSMLDVIKKIDDMVVRNPSSLAAAVAAAVKANKPEIVLLVSKKRNTKTELIRIRLGK